MPHPNRSVRILLTASEAYPALERAFLAAEIEVLASFLIFDLTTRLRSTKALMIGRTWFDLIFHTLERGVALHFCISDVYSIARAAMHRADTAAFAGTPKRASTSHHTMILSSCATGLWRIGCQRVPGRKPLVMREPCSNGPKSRIAMQPCRPVSAKASCCPTTLPPPKPLAESCRFCRKNSCDQPFLGTGLHPLRFTLARAHDALQQV